MKPNRVKRIWTSEEESRAISLLKEGRTYTEVARILGRTPRSIAHRNIDVWHVVEIKPLWTEAEERKAKGMLIAGCSYREVSLALNRSITALRKKNSRDWRISNMKPGDGEMKMTPGKKYANLRRFDGNRYRVLRRDMFTCRDCGLQDTSDSVLQVHHLDGNGRGSEFPNNDLDNLVTLCVSCHVKRHNQMKKEIQYA